MNAEIFVVFILHCEELCENMQKFALIQNFLLYGNTNHTVCVCTDLDSWGYAILPLHLKIIFLKAVFPIAFHCFVSPSICVKLWIHYSYIKAIYSLSYDLEFWTGYIEYCLCTWKVFKSFCYTPAAMFLETYMYFYSIPLSRVNVCTPKRVKVYRLGYILHGLQIRMQSTLCQGSAMNV